MITLDASLVIAHLNPSDPHHESATSYLRDTADETLLIHSVNLAEVLIGGVRAGRADEMRADLHAIGIRVAAPSEGEPLRLARLRVESRLRMPDCCALDTALRAESTLATFDDALAKAARSRHITIAPDSDSPAAGPSRGHPVG